MGRAGARSRAVYRVFVCSTYLDNKRRREVVGDAILRAGMQPVGMARFTASTHPTVDECLKLAGEADVLVGIVAWKYGWIPEGRQFSITELEYDAAAERLMFEIDRSVPVQPERDFDPGPGRWEKQQKLEAFKGRFAADQMPVPFKDDTLGQKVLHALTQWREEREKQDRAETKKAKRGARPAPRGRRKLAADVRSYCAKADAFHADLPVAGFVTQLKVPIDIEDIYIPLRSLVDLRGVSEERFADAKDAEKCLGGGRENLEIPLPDGFRECAKRKKRGVVILGDPGAGKTTHLKRLLLSCVRKGPQRIGLPAEMIPIFLPLRELCDVEHGLDAFIQQQLANPHLSTPKGFGKRLLERGNLLFLFDGLDEVGDITQRREVSRWIEDALKAHRSCWFVVTSRYAGYAPEVALDEHFLEMHIRPLTDKQAEKFVRTWFRIVETGLAKDPKQGELAGAEKADALVTRLREPDFRARRVYELTHNPLLLTNLCLVQRTRGSLPKKRARLYEECIDVLLEHWHSAKGLESLDAEAGRRVLQPAALWMHQENARTRATAKELAPVIGPALEAVKWPGGSAGDFLRMVRDRTGVLTGWDQERYGFMHLGFQEYLAAREIRRLAFDDPKVLSELAGHFGDSWWHEVALLLLASADPSLFVPYMRAVLGRPEAAEHSAFLDNCLEDAAEVSTVPFREVLAKTPGRKRAFWQLQLAALRVLQRLDPEAVQALQQALAKHPFEDIRAFAGVRRAEARADRKIVRPDRGDYELVRIPGGSFLMGSPESEEGRWDDESPQHQVRVADFCMGRYPVTNAQYAQFLKENPEAEEPQHWGDRKYNQEGQPVVGVSWNDAQSYAKWAGLRLPSEAEWEYACRAGTATRYYTGNEEGDLDRAGWYGENSEGRLHPVGEKEPNAYGLYDMHGNVYEWVEDDWHSRYQGAPGDGRAWMDSPRGPLRVFRGGCFRLTSRSCRAASRLRRPADYRWIHLGFRLVRAV